MTYLSTLEIGCEPVIVFVDVTNVVLAFDFRIDNPSLDGRIRDQKIQSVLLRSKEGHVLSGKFISPKARLHRPDTYVTLTEAQQYTSFGILALPNLILRRDFLTVMAEDQRLTDNHWKLFRPSDRYDGPIIGSSAHRFFRDRLWLNRAMKSEPNIQRNYHLPKDLVSEPVSVGGPTKTD